MVNNIPKDKTVYNNTLEDYALMDNKLSASQTDIGQSSNLAQLAQTYMYTYDDEKYNDYACILAVLAQIQIDSSKKRFDVDTTAEIKRIQKEINVKENGYPIFWQMIRKNFSQRLINKKLVCPVNYVGSLKAKTRKIVRTIKMDKFIKIYEDDCEYRKNKKAEELIVKYMKRSMLLKINTNMENGDEDSNHEELVVELQDLIEDLKGIKFSKGYRFFLSYILRTAFEYKISRADGTKGTLVKATTQKNETISTNISVLINVLYNYNKTLLLDCLSKNLSEQGK